MEQPYLECKIYNFSFTFIWGFYKLPLKSEYHKCVLKYRKRCDIHFWTFAKLYKCRSFRKFTRLLKEAFSIFRGNRLFVTEPEQLTYSPSLFPCNFYIFVPLKNAGWLTIGFGLVWFSTLRSVYASYVN